MVPLGRGEAEIPQSNLTGNFYVFGFGATVKLAWKKKYSKLSGG
jgi:hypothetical protein